MKVVLDTNTLISAIFWKGRENAILRECYAGRLRGFTSPQIIAEVEHVMRDYFHAPKPKIKQEIDLMLTHFQVVQPKEKADAIKEDPADNKILECATEAKVDYIISGDRHLLKLKKHGKTKILNSKEFTKKLR